MSEIASGAAGSGSWSRPATRRACASLVAAEQALDAGARRRQLHAEADRFGRGERDALEQIGMALGETPLRGERAGPGQQQLDSRLGGPRRRASGAGRR